MPYKKAALQNLEKYIDKEVVVFHVGGRETHGVLKGFDTSMNLSMVCTLEMLSDSAQTDEEKSAGIRPSRPLGAVLAKGSSVLAVAPKDGMEQIENPYLACE